MDAEKNLSAFTAAGLAAFPGAGVRDSGVLAKTILAEVLSTHFDIDMFVLTPDSLLDDLGLDSLEMVDLGLALETRYDIEIEAAALSDVRTLGELTGLIGRQVDKLRGRLDAQDASQL